MNDETLEGDLLTQSAVQSPPDVLTSQECKIIPSIAELIRQAREEKGISQKEIAKLAGLTNIHLSRIEHGSSLPTRRTLVRLAPYLGLSLNELFLSAHYQGRMPGDKPVYAGLNGEVVDLEAIVRSMYRDDGELLLLVWQFYKHYSVSDSRLLKILLGAIEKSRETDAQTNVSNRGDSLQNNKDGSSKRQLFTELYNALKQFLFSLDRFLHAV